MCRRLIRDYKTDIARFADANMRIKAQKCYESIPYQLTKENHIQKNTPHLILRMISYVRQ